MSDKRTYLESDFPVLKTYSDTDLHEIRMSNTISCLDVKSDQATTNDYQIVEFNSGSKITEIAPSCFMNCKSLKKVTIQEGTDVIGQDAFRNCTSLTDINLDGKTYQYIGDNAFLNTRITELNLSYTLSKSTKTNFILENSYTFSQNNNLTSITANTNCIDTGMFLNCNNLKNANITIDNTQEFLNIGLSVFNNCQNLEKLTINGDILIDDWFKGCNNLTQIDFVSSDILLGSNVFAGLDNLTVLNVPEQCNLLFADDALSNSNILLINIQNPNIDVKSLIGDITTKPKIYRFKTNPPSLATTFLDLYSNTIKNSEKTDFRYGLHYGYPYEAWLFCEKNFIPMINYSCRSGCGGCRNKYICSPYSPLALDLYKKYTEQLPVCFTHVFGSTTIPYTCEFFSHGNPGKDYSRHIIDKNLISIPLFCHKKFKYTFDPLKSDFVLILFKYTSDVIGLPSSSIYWKKNNSKSVGCQLVDEFVFLTGCYCNYHENTKQWTVNASNAFHTYLLNDKGTDYIYDSDGNKKTMQINIVGRNKTNANTYNILLEYIKKNGFKMSGNATELQIVRAFKLYDRQIQYVIGEYVRDPQFNADDYVKKDPFEDIVMEQRKFTCWGLGHNCTLVASDGTKYTYKV